MRDKEILLTVLNKSNIPLGEILQIPAFWYLNTSNGIESDIISGGAIINMGNATHHIVFMFDKIDINKSFRASVTPIESDRIPEIVNELFDHEEPPIVIQSNTYLLKLVNEEISRKNRRDFQLRSAGFRIKNNPLALLWRDRDASHEEEEEQDLPRTKKSFNLRKGN